MRAFQRTPWNLEQVLLWEQVLEYWKQNKIHMPKLQEHHSKGSQWCKINIDLFSECLFILQKWKV